MSETITPAAPAAPAEPAAPAAPAAAPGATLLTNAVDPAAPPASVDPAAPPAAPAEPAKVIPETYEFQAPEGVTFDPTQVEAFTPIAKELGLTNEQAQKLVDLHVANTRNAQEQQAAQWKTVTEDWANQTRADKEIGGVKFAENMGIAAKAIDKFGSRELRDALDTSGMGNHPAVVKFFVSVGKQLAEDAMLNGAAGQGGKSDAELLFPTMFQTK